MADSIFISYRRSESTKDARALYERLSRDFGRGRVFIDLEGIDPGEDFAATIERQLDGCSVFLVLIGKDWLDGRNPAGQRRLDNEGDFVRLELGTAIARGIRVIPVLVDGAAPPAAADLPPPLQPLARLQAIVLDFNRFDADLARLSATIRKALEVPQPAAAHRWPGLPLPLKISIGVAGMLLLWWWLPRLSVPQDLRAQPAARKAAAVAGPASAAAPRPAPKPFRDCEDGTCPSLVTLAKGRFTMGSASTENGRTDEEGPQHEVRIDHTVAVTETEITRGQFRAFAEATSHATDGGCHVRAAGKWQPEPSRDWRNPGFEQSDVHPVVCVNWNDAVAYARWLSARTGQRYRLPSEAEWEYAARAGSTTRYAFGDRQDSLCAYANVADRSLKGQLAQSAIADCTDGHVTTAPVRSFKPNAWGLYDMHGNAWEWVQDCGPGKSYDKAPTDGSSVEADPCPRRVARGGAWSSEPDFARSAQRIGNAPIYRAVNLGFRLVRLP